MPQGHYAKFRKEIDQLVNLKVLKPTNDSEWGSPIFCLLKKDSTDFQSDRVLHQRLTLGEYIVSLLYIKGEKNDVVNALSRLPTVKL